MAKAKKLPSGNWRCMANVTINGKQVRKSFTAATKKEAEWLASEFIHEGAQAGSDCTVSKAIDTYITNRTNTCSPSTIRGYRLLQKKHYASIENLRVSTITSEDMQRFVNSISASMSPKSVRNIYGLLTASILSVTPDKRFFVNLPQKEVTDYNLPTDDDVKRLLAESDGPLRIAILLASIGTMRRGEICALDYSDITGNVIHVHRDMIKNTDDKWIIKGIPKTSSSDRYIEYPKKVIKEIGTGEGLIVPLNPNNLTYRFTCLRDKLGLKCRFHDLRHYSASIMHAIGVPDQYIMEVGGWSSDTVLKSVYRNVLNDKQKEFSDKRNNFFNDKFLA
jgi:integrase